MPRGKISGSKTLASEPLQRIVWSIHLANRSEISAMARRHVVFALCAFVCTLHSLPAAATDVPSVTFGSVLKLEHIATGHRLHSHSLPYGQGSGQQSVTGMYHAGDANSYWVVKGPHGGGAPATSEPVACGARVRLQHLSTQRNLHSHLHRAPMNGDFEVSAYAQADEGVWREGDSGDNWRVMCERARDGAPWPRGGKLRLKHEDTGAFLSASGRLKYGDPIANQLHVSARKWSNADCYWRAAEGFFLAEKEEKK